MDSDVVALASDHAGVRLKEMIRAHVEARGLRVIDLGTDGDASVDYPDYGYKLAEALKSGAAARGIAICGTGIGISIAANRYSWVRAGLAHDVTSARLCREHNDANLLALGARLIGEEVAKECVSAFLDTAFGGDRHKRRVEKLGHPPVVG